MDFELGRLAIVDPDDVFGPCGGVPGEERPKGAALYTRRYGETQPFERRGQEVHGFHHFGADTPAMPGVWITSGTLITWS